MIRFQTLLLIGWWVPLTAQGAVGDPCARTQPYAECGLAAGGIPALREMTVLPGEREVRFWVTPDRGSNSALLRLVQRGDSVTASLAFLWPGSARGSAEVATRCRQEAWGPTAGFCVAALPPSRDWAGILRQLDSIGLTTMQSAPTRGIVCDTTPLPPLVPGGLPRDRLCRMTVHPTIHVVEVRTPDAYWRYQLPIDADPTDPNGRRDARMVRVLRCAQQEIVADGCPAADTP